MNTGRRYRDPIKGKRWPDLPLSSGRVLYPQTDNKPMGNRLFSPVDVAHHLSMWPWNPATRLQFTLAQFAVLVGEETHKQTNNPDLALLAMFVDAGRIMTGPLLGGVREFLVAGNKCGRLVDLERRLHACATAGCKLPKASMDEFRLIKTAVKSVAARAYRDLMPDPRDPVHGLSGTKEEPRGQIIKPMAQDRAKDKFLSTWDYYATLACREGYAEIEDRLNRPDPQHNQYWRN